MNAPSYSVPAASCFEGAHRSAMPCVPTAYATTGRSPAPNQAALGFRIVPVTTVGPWALALVYITRVTSAGARSALSGSR